jgi:hypothetical protein
MVEMSREAAPHDGRPLGGSRTICGNLIRALARLRIAQ